MNLTDYPYTINIFFTLTVINKLIEICGPSHGAVTDASDVLYCYYGDTLVWKYKKMCFSQFGYWNVSFKNEEDLFLFLLHI